MRCTQATLEALGIFGKSPTTGTGVVEEIQRAGFKWSLVNFSGTVGAFVKSNPAGCFYLSTSGHAMALVNGNLTDTTGQGANRRRIEAVIRIIK